MKMNILLNITSISVLIAISIITSLLIQRHFNDEDIIKAVQKTNMEFSEKVFNLHSEIYLTLDRLPLPQKCNRKIFERLIYKYKHIKNIGIINDNKIVCDVYNASKLNSIVYNYFSFQHDSDTIYKYWNTNEYVSVSSPDGYFVEYDTSYYSNFDIKDEISGLFIYGRQSEIIWFTKLKHDLSESEVTLIKDTMIKEFKKLNSIPQIKTMTLKYKNLIFNIRIADQGSIVGVVSDTNFVKSYHKIAFLNLLLGSLLGLLISVPLLHFYYKRKSIKNLLIRAIKNEELKVVYQPLVDLNSSGNPICGFEALARWTLNNGDDIRPDIFIAIAEKHHLTVELTRLIIKIIFKELAETLKQNPDLYVAINVSNEDLYESDIRLLLNLMLEKYELSPKNVVIELTERSIVDKQSMPEINALKLSQFPISIDDFGTGASNVKYLADLKPNIIKIDKSFVTWSDSDGPTSTLLGSLIKIGSEFDVKIVVEGVETQEQAQRCVSLGANVGQGYLWYKPLPIQAIVKILKGRH